MSVRTVTVSKASPDDRVGVRLADAKGKGVKVVELAPSGMLVGNVKKGEIILSINGVPCTSGHVQAAEMLKTSPTLTLEVAKRPSMFSKSSSSKSKAAGMVAVTAAVEPSEEEQQPQEEEEVVPVPEAEGEAVEGAGVAVAAAAVPMAASPTPTKSDRGTPRPPSSHGGSAHGSNSKPPSFSKGTAADEYTVVLHRKDSKSIGMRLVQKRHTDLPFIADIDPNGPAANSNINKGDFILEVNGVDSRASHEELKKALGKSGEEAVLKLRRAPTPIKVGRSGDGVNPNDVDAALKEEKQGWFSMCCAPRPQVSSAA